MIKLSCRMTHKSGSDTCERINEHFRKLGMTIGDCCRIYSNIGTSESYLITIGDGVTISNDVQLITHDNSIIKVVTDSTDLFGEVIIGDSCFIGAHSIVLPGVTIGDHCIVGAGSVVSKSIPEGSVAAGNPARVIGKLTDFCERYKDKAFNIEGMSPNQIKELILENTEKLIQK